MASKIYQNWYASIITYNSIFVNLYVVASVDVQGGACKNCKNRSGHSILRLHLTINLSMAAPGTPPELISCPVCDRLWNDSMCQPLKLPSTGRGDVAQVSGTYSSNGSTLGGNMNSVPMASSVSSLGSSYQWHSLNSGSAERSTNSGHVSNRNIETSDYGAAAAGSDFYSNTSKGKQNYRGAGHPSYQRGSRSDQSDNGDVPLCACNESSVKRTVMKDGANKGRQFWCCAKPR